MNKELKMGFGLIGAGTIIFIASIVFYENNLFLCESVAAMSMLGIGSYKFVCGVAENKREQASQDLQKFVEAFMKEKEFLTRCEAARREGYISPENPSQIIDGTWKDVK
jgi:hypothetical protein